MTLDDLTTASEILGREIECGEFDEEWDIEELRDECYRPAPFDF